MSAARPLLAVRRSAPRPARLERIGWFVLAALACLLAHETTYQLLYPGRAYRAAMTVTGHDGYWLGLTVALAIALLGLVVVALVQLVRLRREAASTPALASDEAAGVGGYLRLVRSTWLRLAVLAMLMFTAQENLEALAAGLPLRGIDVVLGHGLLPLFMILLTTALVALVVALVRWRRRLLLGRLAAAAHPWSRDAARRRRPASAFPAPVRLLAGAWVSRAPPRVTLPVAL
jgi:uncharacterized membrane protein